MSGTALDSEKDEHDRVCVWLDTDESNDQSQVRVEDSGELVEALRDRVRYLEELLGSEREARTEERRRHDIIIAQLSRANAELSRPVRDLEASEEPASGAQEVQDVAEGPAEGSRAPVMHMRRRRQAHRSRV